MARHSLKFRAQTPGGSNFCSTDRAPLRHRACEAPSRSCGLSQIRRQVAGLVDEIDQILPDHALRRPAERHRKLFGEMAAERHLGGDEGFQIVVVVVGGAAAPFGIGGRCRILRRCGRRLRPALRKRRCRAGCPASARSRCGCRGRGSSTPPGRARRPSPPEPRDHIGGIAAAVLAGHSCRNRGTRRARRPARPPPGPPGRRWRAPAADCAPVPPRRRPTRSRFDSCSSLIACINCGVITSDCDWRNSNLCVSAMEARTDPLKVGPILAYLFPRPDVHGLTDCKFGLESGIPRQGKGGVHPDR